MKNGKGIEMLRRALKFAIGPSIGITIAGLVIPWIAYSERYNETYPPILLHAGVYFIIGYIVSFLVCLLIEWGKSKYVSK